MEWRAADYLVEAIRRTAVPEDRLTELVACALNLDADLRTAFLDLAGLSDHRTREIWTQVETDELGHKMDMLLDLTAPNGDLVELWCEHKLNSPFGREQLANYRNALGLRREDDDTVHFLAILLQSPPENDRRALEAMGAVTCFWHDIAALVDKVGRGRQSDWRMWRDVARDPDAVGELRVLAELDYYLRDIAGVKLQPAVSLSHVHAVTRRPTSARQRLARSTAAREIGLLLESIAGRLSAKGQRVRTELQPPRALQIVLPDWWDALGGTLSLWVAADAAFGTPPAHGPSFGASVTLPLSFAARAVERRADARKLQVTRHARTVETGASMSIGDVLGLPSRAQADVLSPFADTTIARLRAARPTISFT